MSVVKKAKKRQLECVEADFEEFGEIWAFLQN